MIQQKMKPGSNKPMFILESVDRSRSTSEVSALTTTSKKPTGAVFHCWKLLDHRAICGSSGAVLDLWAARCLQGAYLWCEVALGLKPEALGSSDQRLRCDSCIGWNLLSILIPDSGIFSGRPTN
ncbi:MAG: hypothetical protein WCI65_03410 [Synechococcaceae cyanobacterium ELA263]